MDGKPACCTITCSRDADRDTDSVVSDMQLLLSSEQPCVIVLIFVGFFLVSYDLWANRMRALVARLLLSMPSQLVTYLKSDTYHTDRPMMGTGYIGLSTWKVYLTALFTDRHTDKYDLKVRHSTLRTLTNSFTLRVRNKYCRIFRNLFSLALYARGPDRSLFTNWQQTQLKKSGHSYHLPDCIRILLLHRLSWCGSLQCKWQLLC